MHIEKVNIQNFRLFEALELILNRGLNILVGENDSGKTALIDAIRYTLGTNSNDRIFVSESDFFNDARELTIQLKFSQVDAHAHRFVEHLTHEEYEDAEGNRKRRSVLYIQLRAERTGMERRGYPYIKTEVRSGIDGNGLPVEAEIRHFLATTYLKPLRDAEAELSSGRASRLSQILSSSKDIRDGADAILAIIAQANDDLLADNAPLKLSAQNIQSNYLHQLIFEKDKGDIGVFIDIAGLKNSDIPDLSATMKRRHLRTILEGLSLALTEDRRLHGLGYHNLLFIGAELLLLEQEADNEFPLLMIEEPEAHLHPQLQMKLLQFINSKAKSDGNPDGIQCIVSSHSPNISSKADPSEVILLGGGKAWALRPGETELDHDDYKYLRKFLDATKANVFFAKGLLFVEGESENILLPEIARLLGRPLEDYGVSIVKCDNAGSWKRFVKLFLRHGKDEQPDNWPHTKVCVLRDLDLWPLCAEERADGANRFGFLERKEPNALGRGGNLGYWEEADAERLVRQIGARKQQHKEENGVSFERQRVKVCISDRWTFEFCLARYGLFPECCAALGVAEIEGADDEKATYIQGQVDKTDFAYDLADTLRSLLNAKIAEAVAGVEARGDERESLLREAKERARADYAASLKRRLPPYIVEAIEHVTAPITVVEQGEEHAPPD